jgi:hypothetical protein
MRALSLVLLAACQGPAGGGGQGPSPIAQTGSGGTTGTSGTTISTTAPATWDGPLSDVPPTTTFVETDDLKFLEEFSATGDFDGNGIADYARQTTAGLEVWFGPLPTGEVPLGTGATHIASATDGIVRAFAAGDIDGDGRDELAVHEGFLTVPSSGDYTVADLLVTTVLPDANTVHVLDVDADGHLDLVRTGVGVGVRYGPIPPGVVEVPIVWDVVPDASSAFLRGAGPECPFGMVDFAPDLDGDAVPDMLISTDSMADIDASVCGAEDYLIFRMGDLRGQVVERASALRDGLTGYPRFLPDVNGDGLSELILDSELCTGPAVIADGMNAAILATLPSRGSFNPFIDLNGDGRREVRLDYRLIDGSLVTGALDPLRDGIALDPDIIAVTTRDFDGDGVEDVMTLHDIWSGSDLQARWQQATGG